MLPRAKDFDGSAMNNDTKKVSMVSLLARPHLHVTDVQVNTQNPDEEEVLKTLKKHSSKSLEADLVDSEVELGLTQARIWVTCATSLRSAFYRPPT